MGVPPEIAGDGNPKILYTVGTRDTCGIDPDGHIGFDTLPGDE